MHPNSNDTGIFNIPSDAISKFPRYANITVVLMRGNAEIIEKEAKSNYLVTSSEQYEHIVLSN